MGNSHIYATLQDSDCAKKRKDPRMLPRGYRLAPNDGDSHAAILAAPGWSTHCVVLADGTSWTTSWLSPSESDESPGTNCGSDSLVRDGDMYSVSYCHKSVLIRCP